MKIATFNINGIKARLPALTDWLAEAQPDVALLQEIKSTDETFPRTHFEDLGYQVETHGQKSFNGVASCQNCRSKTSAGVCPEMTRTRKRAGLRQP